MITHIHNYSNIFNILLFNTLLHYIFKLHMCDVEDYFIQMEEQRLAEMDVAKNIQDSAQQQISVDLKTCESVERSVKKLNNNNSKNNSNNKKVTLRQHLAQLSMLEQTQEEKEMYEILNKASKSSSKKNDVNIMKIFPEEILKMPVFTNEHAVETIQELVNTRNEDILRSMPIVINAMQSLLMKIRGIYTRKEFKK